MLGGAFVNDGSTHAPVVQHPADVGVARDDGQRTEVDLGVHLDGLRAGALEIQDARLP